MLRALFADPALAASQQYADALREYLRSESIGPLPFRRLAAAVRPGGTLLIVGHHASDIGTVPRPPKIETPPKSTIATTLSSSP